MRRSLARPQSANNVDQRHEAFAVENWLLLVPFDSVASVDSVVCSYSCSLQTPAALQTRNGDDLSRRTKCARQAHVEKVTLSRRRP